MIIRMQHCRDAGYCVQGVRRFCEKYGVKFEDFLQNGIDADLMLELTNNDEMAVKVVEVARGIGK